MKITVREDLRNVTGSLDAVKIFHDFVSRFKGMDVEKEHFWAVMLDTKHKVKCAELVTLGTLDSTLIHPREVFRKAVHCAAACIIVGHNHPTGIISPSNQDRAATRSLQDAGRILGIQLMDHIIVGTAGSPDYYSFAENGW